MENDPVRTLITRELASRGISMSEASKKMGKDAGYLRSFLKRGRPQKLAEDARKTLAKLIDVDDDGLLKTGATAVPLAKISNARPTPGKNQNEFGPRNVPVRGKAAGGPDGALMITSDVIDYVERSPELMNVRDAYALFVDGDSMTDFGLVHGSTVYVHPHRRPQARDFCVVILRSGLTYIKRMVRTTQTKVIVEQSDPRKPLEFAVSEVEAVHLVTGATFRR